MATDLVVTERRAAMIPAQPPENHTLVAVMDRLAANPNLDADKIEKLLNVFLDGQRRMAEMQDEKLFGEAMAAFKNEPSVVRILKDKKNKQYGNSPYVSLGQEAAAVTPLLSKHGLTATWTLSQGEKIKIGCQISYGLFHDKPVTIELLPDKSGSKNPAQEIKSAITYGRIITLECACGIAPIDSVASLNDDGNGTGGGGEDGGQMEQGAILDWIAKIEAAASGKELETEYFKARDIAEAAKDKNAASEFAEAKNARYKKLYKEGRV